MLKKQNIVHNVRYIFHKEFTWYPQQKRYLALRFVFEFLYSALVIAIPATAIQCIESGRSITTYGFVMIVFIAGSYGAQWGRDWANQWANKVNSWCRCGDFTEELLRRTLTIRYQNVENHEKQVLLERAADALRSNWTGVELMMKRTPDLCINLICLVIYSTAILVMDWRVLLLLIVMCLVNVKLNQIARDYMYRHYDVNARSMKNQKYLFRIATELKYYKDIALYRLCEWIQNAYKKNTDDRRLWSVKTEGVWILPAISDLLFTAIRDGLVYVVLIHQVVSKQISISTFSLYIGIVNNFASWLMGVISAVGDLQRANLQVKDYRAVENTMEGIALQQCGKTENKAKTIEFRNVSFRYPNEEKNVIDHLNLAIAAGEKIALVGENGAGKTTLVKILCGLYEPTEGEVLIDGKKMEDYSLSEYMNQFSVIFQDSDLFACTIEQNLTGQDNPDEVLLSQCLDRAGMIAKIDKLEYQLKTNFSKRLDERGIEFSGGEKQKLLFARALYKDAPILVMDEPTAALDPIAESSLYEDYKNMMSQKTSIFISHRMASTRFCDRILYFEHGRIVEEGTHEELMKAGGKYADVFQVQSQYYTEAFEARVQEEGENAVE